MTAPTGIIDDENRGERSVGDRHWPAPVRLARRMAREIVDGGVPVGTHLGSLPEIGQRFDVSVPTLRKALVHLLDDGIVTMREGRGGGLFIAAPPIESAMRAMHLYLSDRNHTPAQVAEARATVDGAIIERAVRLAGEADHARMRPSAKVPGGEPALLASIAELDEAILSAGRQPILALFSKLTSRFEQAETALALAEEWRLRRGTADAILAGNLGDALALWNARRSLPPTRLPDERSGRLADELALTIKDHIHGEGLSAGAELGREAELQERFAASRTTIRDAVRILERNGAVKVTPGRSGGVFVGSAEPYAAIEMTSLYLSAVQLDFATQIEARRVVEARAAQLSAQRITPSLADELERAVEGGTAAARIPSADWPAKGARIERLIAQACCNPLIEFFTLVLIEFSMSGRDRVVHGLAPPDFARLVSLHHSEIVADILSRRAVDAAFHTRVYLTDLARWFENRATSHPDPNP